MKRLIACGVLAALIAAVVAAGITNARRSTAELENLVDQAVWLTRRENQEEADIIIDRLNSRWQQDKEVLMSYTDQMAVDDADRQVTYLCALSRDRSEDFFPQAEVCRFLIHHIYENERITPKALF